MMKEFAHFLYVGTPKTGDTREALWTCQLVFVYFSGTGRTRAKFTLCILWFVRSAEGAGPPTEVHIPNPF